MNKIDTSPEAPQAPASNDAEWFALVMGAAAAIEDAAACLRDADAKRVAEGAAKHYREKAKSLGQVPLPAGPAQEGGE